MKRFFILLTAIFILIFAGSVMAEDYVLEWDANTETDLAGYKVYYKVNGTGPPYYGTGADQGDSPIDVGLLEPDENGNITYTLTGLPGEEELGADQRIRFVVTAYNTMKWESGFSNEPDLGVPTPPNLKVRAPSP